MENESLKFIQTYGWAILILILLVGAFFSLDLINLENWKPKPCVEYQNSTVLVESWDQENHYIGKVRVQSEICVKRLGD
jgi:hypothetical protein